MTNWNFDAPSGTFKNDRLSDILYYEALRRDSVAQRLLQESQREYHNYHGHSGEPGMSCTQCNPPIPLWRRLRSRWDWWWYEHKPQLHFGPCPHEDE